MVVPRTPPPMQKIGGLKGIGPFEVAVPFTLISILLMPADDFGLGMLPAIFNSGRVVFMILSSPFPVKSCSSFWKFKPAVGDQLLIAVVSSTLVLFRIIMVGFRFKKSTGVIKFPNQRVKTILISSKACNPTTVQSEFDTFFRGPTKPPTADP